MSAGGKPQLEAEKYPSDYRKRHPIAIREGERTVELFIGTNRGGLTPAQRAEVMSFAQSWKREGTGGMAIDLPTGTPNAMASSDALREINSMLAAAGVPPQGVAVRPYQPVDTTKLATLKLNYGKIVAEAGPCGLWPKDLGASMDRSYAENTPYWNLGCANQRNLAAMVDNPADLAQPRGEGAGYTPRRTYVIDQYKRGQDSATVYRNPNNGKISDVGQ
jgi:pilus assembly protein CpaD